jgi:CheY-like chemotaxis protein
MTKRVLIADEDDDALSGLANLLNGLGYQVAQASCESHALDVARQFGPEVVILDLGKSPINGLSCASGFRALPNGPAMLLVALTGWGQPQLRAMTQEAGFDIHLVKPVSIGASRTTQNAPSHGPELLYRRHRYVRRQTRMLHRTNAFAIVRLSPPCLY